MNKDNKLDDISDLLKQYDQNVNNIINNQDKNENVDNIGNHNNEIINDNIHETTNSSFIKNEYNSKNETKELYNFTNSINNNSNNNISTDNNLHAPSKNNNEIKPTNNNKSTNNSKLYIGYEIRLGARILSTLIFLVLFVILLLKYTSYNKNTNEYYSENSQSGYSVCLNENEYYEESCLGENKQYLTKLVKNIPYIFSYNSLYSYNVEKIYNYYVTAHLKIFSQDNESSILYEKIFNLIDKTEYKDNNSVFTIANDVVIPFTDYQSLVTKYNNDYGVLSNSEVVIDFYVNNKSVSSITIPLGRQTFSITKRDTDNTVLVDNDLKKTIEKNSTLLLICMLLSGILAIASILILLKFVMKYSNRKDEIVKFRNEIKNILKNYDRIIVEVKDIDKLLENKVIIKVESFLELVDVRDTLDKPILHVKINSIKEGFYVEDNDKVYSFIMKAK